MTNPMRRFMEAIERDCPPPADGVSVADTAGWIGAICVVISLGALAVEPSWRHLFGLMGDIGFVLIAVVAGAGWLRVQKLERQRTDLVRQLDAAHRQMGNMGRLPPIRQR